MLYKKYRYIIYTIELTADRAEAELGEFSLRSAYAHSFYRTFLAPTYIILHRHSWGYIRLVYTIDMRR